MIDAEHQIAVDCDIGAAWTYVSRIDRWATLMPGYRECQEIDGHHSRWVLKVGVAGLLRTVTVLVEVDRWDGPTGVDFHYALDGDPVEGSGTYRAEALDADHTAISLQINVAGTGKMAPMWEAMGRPLLPKFVRSFAEQLKSGIESGSRKDAV